jgi:hypothetical protein
VRYLEENLRALEVHLEPRDFETLDRLFPVGAAKGDRYPAGASQLIDR